MTRSMGNIPLLGSLCGPTLLEKCRRQVLLEEIQDPYQMTFALNVVMYVKGNAQMNWT